MTSQSLETVNTSDAPPAAGPYSQATATESLVFCSGTMSVDATSKNLVGAGSVEDQTAKVLDNLAAVLSAAGSSMENVVKTTIFLVDMRDFSKVNDVYKSRFQETLPARACVAVSALPIPEARVEIEAIALRAK